MTAIPNYNKMFVKTPDGNVNMMDRTGILEGVGEIVWINWHLGDSHLDFNIIDFHIKEDVLNNFNPLLENNTRHPYMSDRKDYLSEDGDMSCCGNAFRIAYKEYGDGCLLVQAFFLHPRFQGKGLASRIFAFALATINRFYSEVKSIILNAKAHPISKVPTNALRNWYKGMGFQELGIVMEKNNLRKFSHKSMYSQVDSKLQGKVRKEADKLLVMLRNVSCESIDDLVSVGFGQLLADWRQI